MRNTLSVTPTNTLNQLSKMAAKYLARCLDPLSGIPTDVTFLFHGENIEEPAEKVKAHKPILAAASAVFQREFYGSMKEADGEIEIVDASKEVFQAMVNYIYSYEEMKLDSYALSFIASLFYLAEKYDIGDIKDEILGDQGECSGDSCIC